MANDEENKAYLDIEARINEESFDRAETRAKERAFRMNQQLSESAAESERAARNAARVGGESGEDPSKADIAAMRAAQNERNRIDTERRSLGAQLSRDEQQELQSRVTRERAQATESAAIHKSLTQEQQAELAARIAREKSSAAEAAAIQKSITQDEQRELIARVGRQEAARAEAAAIHRAMLADEAKLAAATKAIRDKAAAEEVIRNRAVESLQAQRSRALFANFQREEREAARAARAAQTVAGEGRGIGGASRFAIRRTIAEGGQVVGASELGSIASLAAYGPLFAVLGAALGGVAIAFFALKQAIADDKAELAYAATIRTIGIEFSTAKDYAEQFHVAAVANREESYALAGAFAGLHREGVQTSAADIQKILTIAQARGEEPKDAAKVLTGIGKGDVGAFEQETGLRANVVIDEYARSIGKLPDQLTGAAKAQALYNAYLSQSINLTDLAKRQADSAGGTWTKLKNTISDTLAGFGEQLLVHPFIAIAGIATSNAGLTQYVPPAGPQSPQAQEQRAVAEAERQTALAQRYAGVETDTTKFFKDFGRDSAGKPIALQYRELISANEDFKASLKGLDANDEGIQKLADQFESKLATAINQARSEAKSLQSDVRRNLEEFSALQIPGEKNPYVKLYADAEQAAAKAHERFKALGPAIESQFTGLATAGYNAQIFEQRVGDTMKSMKADFEATALARPFTELTGAAKRSIAELQAQIGTIAGAGQVFQARQIESGGAFGFPNIEGGPLPGLHGAELQQIERLIRRYGGQAGRVGDEETHLLNQQLVKLYQELTPAERGRVFRFGDARLEFAGAYRGEADYAEKQVDLVRQRTSVQRQAADDAVAELRKLQQLGAGQTGSAQAGAIRAGILGITGALPREELTPELLKARIGALREEAQHQREAEDAAIKAVLQGETLQKLLDTRLTQVIEAIGQHDQAVILRILDDTGRTRVSTLGPAMGAPSVPPDIGFAPGFRE